MKLLHVLSCMFFLLLTNQAFAKYDQPPLDLTHHWVGYSALCIFIMAYILVALEDVIELRKSKPVLFAAGLIWAVIAVAYDLMGRPHDVETVILHNFLEFAELFFFLLVAMTYINAMLERGVFDALRNWLLNKGFGNKALFWLTGGLAFCLSPIADNLTTALIMCTVVLAVGQGNKAFIVPCCINIVVAANAGGAFSPFGDITTLMVWQKGVVEFQAFFALFVPSLVNFVVPALVMQFALPKGRPNQTNSSSDGIKYGGVTMTFLFLCTIVTAVSFHNFLHIPPVFGMLMGLGYLKVFSFFMTKKSHSWSQKMENPPQDNPYTFDIFDKIASAEWDTLFFFYGVIMAVGGLAHIGYLGMASQFFYIDLGPTTANILVGILSAIVDNIPVMYAVLTMNPDMSQSQWLLVTLTAGVGGSLLSVGSAAGVALMGQARGTYTFMSHLKWTPVIALGYFASIGVHIWLHF